MFCCEDHHISFFSASHCNLNASGSIKLFGTTRFTLLTYFDLKTANFAEKVVLPVGFRFISPLVVEPQNHIQPQLLSTEADENHSVWFWVNCDSVTTMDFRVIRCKNNPCGSTFKKLVKSNWIHHCFIEFTLASDVYWVSLLAWLFVVYCRHSRNLHHSQHSRLRGGAV